jgi:CRP-like cAMP-binding protein
LARLASTAEEVRADAGHVLVAEAMPVHWWHLIGSGRAVVMRCGRMAEVLGPGQSFGEEALLSRRPSAGTVVAVSPLVALAIGQQAFAAALDDLRPFSSRLLTTLAARVGDATMSVPMAGLARWHPRDLMELP